MNSIPRLHFAELTPELQQALGPRVQRLGYLGEFFRCTAHQPDVLLAFHRLTDALKAALPDRLTEVVALTVAALMSNAYERHQHERLSEKLGLGRPWILSVQALNPAGSPELSSDERAVQALTIALVERQGRADEEMEAVVQAIGADGAVAVLFLVGRYVTHALIVNALALAPPVPSIFVDQTEVSPPSTA